MAGENEGGAPGAGWFPDPAGAPAYRWWNGVAWTDDLHPFGSPDQHEERGNRFVRVTLIVSAVLFFAWGGVVALLLPALLINDADNGKLGHDLAYTWIPEVVLGLGAGLLCVWLAAAQHRKERWSGLLWPLLGVAAIALWSGILSATSLGIH